MQKSSFQEYKLWYKPDPTINRHEQSTLKDFLYHVVLHATNSKSLNWLYVPHSNDMDSKFVKQHVHVNHPSWFLMTGYRNLATNGKHDKILTPYISLGQKGQSGITEIAFSLIKWLEHSICYKILPIISDNLQTALCVHVHYSGSVESEEMSSRSGC